MFSTKLKYPALKQYVKIILLFFQLFFQFAKMRNNPITKVIMFRPSEPDHDLWKEWDKILTSVLS